MKAEKKRFFEKFLKEKKAFELKALLAMDLPPSLVHFLF